MFGNLIVINNIILNTNMGNAEVTCNNLVSVVCSLQASFIVVQVLIPPVTRHRKQVKLLYNY